MYRPHPPSAARRISAALFVLILLALFNPAEAASAQPPEPNPDGSGPILYLPMISGTGASQATAESGDEPADELSASHGGGASSAPLLIDTDPGVDDAVALAWLLTQNRPPRVLGVISVAGNSTIANTTNNAITILEKLGRQDIPVVMGAAQPLAQPLSKTTYFIHGPDGLWFLGFQNPHDLSAVRRDAPAFYCGTAAAYPGVRILALGPLTNIAQAVQLCPDTMRTVSQLIVLGGAKFGGNKTPVTEFNFWQDPEAAAIVLGAGLPITLVLLDAFVQPTITQKDLDKLFSKTTPAIQFLAPAIQQYANVQIANTGRAGIPDAVAAVVAMQANEGVRQWALVKMVLAQSLARGESIVGLTTGERIAMIAPDSELSALAELAFANPPDPNFNLQWALGAILMREPDNALAVTSVSSSLLTKTVLPDLRRR
jgi:inosine-uridine nucleoside N-ribohydrolase